MMFNCVSATDCYYNEPSTMLFLGSGSSEAGRRRRRRNEISSRTADPVFEMAYPEIAKELPQKVIKTAKISFNESVAIYHHLHIEDYTSNEIDQTWYTRFELKAMKRECRDFLNEMEEHNEISSHISPRTILGSVIQLERRDDLQSVDHNKENRRDVSPMVIDESSECFRGLEGKTVDGQIKKRMLKENAREVVFREQRRQLHEGDPCPETIASEYKKATALARTAAYRLARKDEKDVLDSLLSDRARDSKWCNTTGHHTHLRLRKAMTVAMVPSAPFSPRLAALLV